MLREMLPGKLAMFLVVSAKALGGSQVNLEVEVSSKNGKKRRKEKEKEGQRKHR